MITIKSVGLKRRYEGKTRYILELIGLSSDESVELATDEFKGYNIDNGSSIFEMDTGKTLYYDLSSEDWIDPTEEDVSID